MLSINAGVAMLTGFQELCWEEKEAAQVADAAKEVAKQYEKSIDPKTLAWINLIGTLGWIEGTRIIAIRARLKKEAERKQPVPLPQPELRVVKPNGAPVPGATIENRTQKPSDDPMAYTLNPIRE